MSVEWPAVLYPARLPQYEGLSASKPAEPPKSSEASKEACAPGRASGVRKTLSCVGLSFDKGDIRGLFIYSVSLLRIKRGNPEGRGRRRLLRTAGWMMLRKMTKQQCL